MTVEYRGYEIRGYYPWYNPGEGVFRIYKDGKEVFTQPNGQPKVFKTEAEAKAWIDRSNAAKEKFMKEVDLAAASRKFFTTIQQEYEEGNEAREREARRVEEWQWREQNEGG